MALPTAPLTGQQAIDRAASRVGGTMSDSGLCLAFTRQCYEVPSYYYSAIDAWNAAVEQHPDDRNPPPSAPVWFWSDSVYRHVAFHLGGNQYATTWNEEIRQYGLGAMEDIFGPLIGWAPDLNTYAMASYMDMLNRNAFGNYRQLLEDVTLHPAMGYYLNMIGSKKADPAKGTHPNENFAREVMQLFSIGLYKLNTEVLDRLEHQGLWSHLARSEPFTQLKRTQLENLVDDYKQRATDQLVAKP